jgi:putative ABC transport system substrate-binding protein
VPRIGYLTPGWEDGFTPTKKAFLDGLTREGYTEGRDVTIEYRFLGERLDRAYDCALELVEMPVDVIVAVGTARAQAAAKATSSIPIVMLSVSDPVEAGLIVSLPQPGGNVTGTSILSAEVAAKRIEKLKDALPDTRRVAVLSTPSWSAPGSSTARQWEGTQRAAAALQLELQLFEIRPDPSAASGSGDAARPATPSLEAAFQQIADSGFDAVAVLSDALFDTHQTAISELAARYRIPVMHTRAEYARRDAGLMAYGADILDQARRGAEYVHRILDGATPATLPVDEPSKFEFAIHLDTAESQGITIDPKAINQATELIHRGDAGTGSAAASAPPPVRQDPAACAQ